MMRHYAQFYAICRALGMDKEEVVYSFTQGRTQSLSAITDGEWKELMMKMRQLQPPKTPDQKLPGDRQRKKLIALAAKMNWGTDMLSILDALNSFLQINYNKQLNGLNTSELNRIVAVFENKLLPDYLSKI
ncbi:hypothetical protein HMPREF0765_4171 [Sphingobacterium spiritivorum ATCC 33300]|uniref:Uncharacterized protein n=1 Tax=Sphingobacterium spiritivorum ATCC 33300 TaxID=525372 RepID=C2G3L5_SPHSI|nr:hypothetical protein [Sphingobacterium spiritivorum]EEI90220.1 hypothetical protein HMPREF0765_4171 [Sphingobacterium spiritivorum ATCC 33300]QQS95146.1 hypothetical protein I6J03_17450 [Sphingobacterium spiritivorum]